MKYTNKTFPLALTLIAALAWSSLPAADAPKPAAKAEAVKAEAAKAEAEKAEKTKKEKRKEAKAAAATAETAKADAAKAAEVAKGDAAKAEAAAAKAKADAAAAKAKADAAKPDAGKPELTDAEKKAAAEKVAADKAKAKADADREKIKKERAEAAAAQAKAAAEKAAQAKAEAAKEAAILERLKTLKFAAKPGVTLPSIDKRFASAADESPSFRRHILPLMGRLGCNGRACHGSFQGQGGFMLSLFGYDFGKDHDAMMKGDPDKKVEPRITLAKPAESPILTKATAKDEDDHGGGHRMDVGSWQYKIFHRWIQEGALNDAPIDCRFDRLEIQPEQHVFKKIGETIQVKVIAHWADGSKEDVTPLCRFRTNDEAMAEISDSGKLKCVGKGDTHVVAFYDNGVSPVQVMLPVSDLVGAKYPKVPTPTRVDELVVEKLRPLGIVPSELSTDEMFLRRVSLDITGTLPTPAEILAFTADTALDKRAKKIDELLARPGYATWWATRLCDITGNNQQQFNEQGFSGGMSEQWYNWLRTRVADNMPYDKIVEGLVLATSRDEGQSYEAFATEMSGYFKPKEPADFTKEDCMPYYWARRNMRTTNEKALGFSYAFLGVRLQCAECHKHPFDQWTQQDFQSFTMFFDRIQYGNLGGDKEDIKKINEAIGIMPDKKLQNNELQKLLNEAVKEGKPIPWKEVYVARTGGKGPRNDNKKVVAGRVITPKLLGDDEISLQEFPDPREALMDWMRQADNPYFARAFVNRVWAAYFKVGIVEPPDDQNLANPPSNEPLLAYLTEGFIKNKFDMKWLHREIANSRTYQLSWKTNDSNALDARNFSHSLIRRLPAEVAYDCLVQATISDKDLDAWRDDPLRRATGLGGGSGGGRRDVGKAGYALSAFGKPLRVTNCDCERSDEPSLLQTMYLRNDGEMLAMIDRGNGWLQETAKALGKPLPAAVVEPTRGREGRAKLAQEVDVLQKKLEEAKKEKDNKAIAKIEGRLKAIREERRAMENDKKPEAKPEAKPETKPTVTTAVAKVVDVTPTIRDIYLRTLSRLPSTEELDRAKKYIAESPTPGEGIRDLLWATMNTKEFIVNH